MGLYTEQGVVSRREKSPDHVINEIREAATKRHTALLADPPTDGKRQAGPDLRRHRLGLEHPAAQPPAGRVDARAGRTPRGRKPGGLDSPAAEHTADYLAESLGYVLAKRVGAPAGTTVVLEIAGHAPYAFAVDENGRGERLTDVPADPTVSLQTDRESFIVLAGGRRAPRARRGRRHRRRRTRPADPRLPGGHPVTTQARAWSLATCRTRRAGRSWSPARPAAASATTPRSSWPVEAAGWSWPAAAKEKLAETEAEIRRQRPERRPRAARGRPRRPRLGAPGGGPRRGRSGRSTCWSTTPG